MFLLTKYQYYICIFWPFPPLPFGAAFSVLAFSTPAFSTVPRFPFSPFQSSRVGMQRNYYAISLSATTPSNQTDHADEYVACGVKRLDRCGFHGKLHQPRNA